MSRLDKAKVFVEIAKLAAEVAKLVAETWAVGRDQRIKDLEAEIKKLKEQA